MKEQILQNLLTKYNVDAVIFHNTYNRKWLLNFSSSFGIVIHTNKKIYFITDARYYAAACSTISPEVNIILVDRNNGVTEIVSKIKIENNIKSVLVESDYLTVDWYLRITKMFQNILAFESRSIREIKTSEEIKLLSESALIATKVMNYIFTIIKIGMSEKEVAKIISIKFLEFGADGNSFDPIVATGKNGASPHHKPGETIIADGDMVTLDIGCMYKGFASDMTRSIIVGSICNTPEMVEIYQKVKESQAAGINAAVVGASGKEVDQSARRVIDSSKWAGLLVHGIGHGVGLEVHELPNTNGANTNKLVNNNVVTVEPGIYKNGVGGVRIEDTIVINNNSAIVLNEMTTKELLFIKND